MRNLTRALTAVLLLAGGLCAGAALAGEPSTPNGRLAAIRPLIEAKAGGEDTQAALAARAEELGIPARRLDLWLDLFVNHGRTGLGGLGRASSVEIAHMVEGTWKLRFRLVDGVPQNVTGYQYHRITELRPDSAVLDSITLEDGCLMPSLCGSVDADQCSFVLGNRGVITYQDVRAPDYGFAADETGVLMTYDGDFRGEGYPGFENGTRGVILALWVKQGETYRTAFFQHAFKNPDEGRIRVWGGPDLRLPRNRNDANITGTQDEQIVEYEEMQAIEQSDRIDLTAPIWDFDAYWGAVKADVRLLKPQVANQATSPEALRLAAAGLAERPAGSAAGATR